MDESFGTPWRYNFWQAPFMSRSDPLASLTVVDLSVCLCWRTNSLVAPRDSEAIVAPSTISRSSSECSLIESLPSRYKLHSPKLKCWPSICSNLSEISFSLGCQPVAILTVPENRYLVWSSPTTQTVIYVRGGGGIGVWLEGEDFKRSYLVLELLLLYH